MFVALPKKVYSLFSEKLLYFPNIRSLAATKNELTCPCAAGLSVRRALLLLQAQMVGDHRNKLRIGGFSLDIRHRVAEELLQHLEIAAVPGDLDRVADFQGFRPERGHALSEDLMLGNA